MRLLLAGLLAVALTAQNPLVSLPRNYRLVCENELVRVIRVTYEAHEKLPVHDHSETPTVYVYLTDSGPVRFSHREKAAFALVRPPQKAGTFRVSPGRLERHEVENLSDRATEFLRVELKKLPLGFQPGSFRGTGRFDTTRSAAATEFSAPAFRIDRVVAVGSAALALGDSENRSVLIAFSPVDIDKTAMKPGDVYCAEPRGSLSVRADGAQAAQVLRIVFAH